MAVDALLNYIWVGGCGNFLSCLQCLLLLPFLGIIKKTIILPFILLVLVLLFDWGKKIIPKRLFIV